METSVNSVIIISFQMFTLGISRVQGPAAGYSQAQWHVVDTQPVLIDCRSNEWCGHSSHLKSKCLILSARNVILCYIIYFSVD